MELSEEQIKGILQQTQLKIQSDLQLEDLIMDEIKDLKPYSQLAQESKRKAKISLRISLGLAACLIVSLLHYLLYTSSNIAIGLERTLPSLLIIGMLLMLYQLLHFGQDLIKESKFSHLQS